MKRSEKRGHLINIATALFIRNGFHATGVDQIIAEAGVAKTTLYRQFPSKEDLIVTVLQRIDEQYLSGMKSFVESYKGTPQEKLLATFDYMEGWFDSDSFYGCPFMSAASEHGDSANPILQEAVVHKRLMIAYFEELARLAGEHEPARVAQEINLLHEGATAVAQINKDSDIAQRAKSMAKSFLAS